MKTKVMLGTRRGGKTASARAHAIARGIVEEYLHRCGGENAGFKFETHEEKLAERIAHAIERAAAR